MEGLCLVFFVFVSLRKVFIQRKEKEKKVCLFDVENLFRAIKFYGVLVMYYR